MILKKSFKMSIYFLILLVIYIITSNNTLYADELLYPVGSQPYVATPAFAGESIYPIGNPVIQKYGVNFYSYNDGSGKLDLNLNRLPIQKTITSPPVVSPNFNHMLYTEVYYYPNNQVTSRAFYVPVNIPRQKDDGSELTVADYLNSYSLRANQKNRSEIVAIGTNTLEDSGFRTITMVDWSYDSTRALLKEHIGRTYTGLAGSIVWIYDINDDKAYRLEEIRKAIINFWYTEKKLDLNQYAWDINLLGWVKDSNSLFVVNAYLYPVKGQSKFLGCWSMDINQNVAHLLSLDDQNWPVGSYGLIPEKY